MFVYSFSYLLFGGRNYISFQIRLLKKIRKMDLKNVKHQQKDEKSKQLDKLNCVRQYHKTWGL